MNPILIHRPKHWASVRRSFLSLRSNDQVQRRRLKRYMLITTIARDRATTNENIVDRENIFNFIVMKYISLIFDDYGPL